MNRLTRIHSLLLILWASVLVSSAQAVISVDRKNSNRKSENLEPLVVSIDAQGRLKLGAKVMTLARLNRAMTTALEERIPPERIIYLKAGPKVRFNQILKLLKLGRTIKHDKFGLILDAEGVHDTTGAVVIKIVLDRPSHRGSAKPNPLYLGLAFEKQGGLSLNGESHTPHSLTTLLEEIFNARADNGVYIEGTEEVERTLFIVPSAATTFGSIVQAATLVREAGAHPIGIEIDGPRPLVIEMNSIRL